MVGILLAAGFSRRFGSEDKLLQLLPDGRTIALASAQALVKAIPNSIAVIRSGNTMLADLLLSAGLKLVLCDEHDVEMADSLSAAIRFSADSEFAKDGFVIALADMPYILSATISEVATRLSSGASIVIPTYQDQRGHPVGFSLKFRRELETLKGDEGARSIIKRNLADVSFFASEDAGILVDIDTPADLSG